MLFFDEFLDLGGEGDVGEVKPAVLVVVALLLSGVAALVTILQSEFLVEFERVHFHR
jgi:hypothetical protein